MDYKRIYDALIKRARTRLLEGYVERHHVIPKCMGGSDEISNLVQLTPEEHFLAHVLLVKIHPEERNLILAVQKMTVGHKGRRSRKLYGWLKRKHAARMRELQSGEGNSQFGSRWINDGNGTAKKHKGELPEGWLEGRSLKAEKVKKQRVISAEARAKMSSARKGKKFPLHSQRMAGGNNPMAGSKYRWYTDGLKNYRISPCSIVPNGLLPGKTQKITTVP